MATPLDLYYWSNPISVIDQNSWALQYPEVALKFRQNATYTPLVDWTNELQTTHSAQGMVVTELLEGETDISEVPLMATSLDSMGVDSRARTFTYANYAGKVSLNRKSNIFNQWTFGGQNNDWTPVLRSVLGNDVIAKHEMLSRNIFLKSPSARWTYADTATNFATIDAVDTFDLARVIDWNFRLGNTGSPVIPGDPAAAKLAIIPPGVTWSFRKSLAASTTGENGLFKDARVYAGQALNYEIGEYSGVRFVEAPSDRFGINPAVLYNAGTTIHQHVVISPIKMGDGAPDPEVAANNVDGVWMVGQKGATHYIQLEDYASGDYVVNDIVTISLTLTSTYGVTGGVDPLATRTIQRRVTAVDHTTDRLTFDRPILFNYDVPFIGSSVDEATPKTAYAYVTKGRNIGMCLILGSRGGVLGAVAEPLKFYEPVAIDDRQQIWRFVYDMTLGYNVWEPNLFELYFCAVSVPKPGGVITQ